MDGVIKYIPFCRNSGWRRWKEDPEWAEAERALMAERALDLNDDSTLTYIRKFIDKRDPKLVNKFYNN